MPTTACTCLPRPFRCSPCSPSPLTLGGAFTVSRIAGGAGSAVLVPLLLLLAVLSGVRL